MTDPFYQGRTVVVTGAAGGIGSALVRMLLSRGARVLAIDVDAPGLARLAQAHPLPDALLTVTSALADAADAQRALAAVDGPLHALVHLAGIFVPHPVAADSQSIWDRTMAANLDNAWALVVAAQPRLQPGTAARIVFTSSLAYRRGAPEHPAYGAAKGALVGLTRSLSRKLAPRGVLVNAVAPGIIETKMTDDIIARRGDLLRTQIPLGRFGTAEEVAGVIEFLCGPQSTYVTGQVISIDGGVVNG